MPQKLNNNAMQRTFITIGTLILLAGVTLGVSQGWNFLSSRASADDVKDNKDAIKEHVAEAEKRLRSVEDNVLVMCEFLNRKDKDAGGDGVRCRRPR